MAYARHTDYVCNRVENIGDMPSGYIVCIVIPYMVTMAVFDSGLGSLSIVRAIRAISSCDIIYYADTASHPYGTKTVPELSCIIRRTIRGIYNTFKPDLVVVGSNTPTLLLDIEDDTTLGVWPPLADAARLTKTGRIGILATRSVVRSDALLQFIRHMDLPDDISVKAIDATELIHQVESGLFLTRPQQCHSHVCGVLAKLGLADVCTLSSTHLPFLYNMMISERPDITFLDPAHTVALRATTLAGNTGTDSLKIYASDIRIEQNLHRLGVTQSVSQLLFDTCD